MSVQQQTTRNPYVGNGVTTVFPFQFKVLAASDLRVYVDDALKTLNVDYTVAGVNVDAGGSVTFISGAPANASRVTIYREMTQQRLTDYQQQGDFNTPTVNPDFDNAVLLIQDLAAKVGRALRLPMTADATDSEIELSPIANWLNRYVTINALGLPEPAVLSDQVVTQSIVGQLLYPQTAAEAAAGVLPTNYASGPNGAGAYSIERYGCSCDGATDDTGGWISAVAVANQGQAIYIPGGKTTVWRGNGTVPTLPLTTGARVYGPGTLKYIPYAAGYIGVFHCGSIYSDANADRSNITIQGVRFYSDVDQQYLHFIGIRNRGGDLTDINVLDCIFRYEAVTHTGSDRWAVNFGGAPGDLRKRINILRCQLYGRMQLTSGGQGADWEDVCIDDNIVMGGYVAGIALTRLDTGAASNYKRVYVRRNTLLLTQGTIGVYLGPDSDSGSPEEENWEDWAVEDNIIILTTVTSYGVLFRRPATGSITRGSIARNTIRAETAINLSLHDASVVVPTNVTVGHNAILAGDISNSWGGVDFCHNKTAGDIIAAASVAFEVTQNKLRRLRLEQSCTVVSSGNTYRLAANGDRGINASAPAANAVVLTSVNDTFTRSSSGVFPACGIRLAGAGAVTANIVTPHDAVLSGWTSDLLLCEDSQVPTVFVPESNTGRIPFTAAAIAAIGNVVNTSPNYKFTGSIIFDSTNNRLMRARGANPNSNWDVVDGSASVTPA